jgi:hypothetical protein
VQILANISKKLVRVIARKRDKESLEVKVKVKP